MSKTWKLERTTQCAKCPWRVGVDPHTIPDGYSVERHQGLAKTIATPGEFCPSGGALNVMACHETEKAHCVGWLNHQLGPGNNIALRLQVRHCENIRDLRTIGPQHDHFEDTLPRAQRAHP